MALNFSSLYWLARQVGLDDQSSRIAAAVALAESSGRPEALGDSGTSYGLWQIHLPAHPWARNMNLYDPIANARAMAQISAGGTNWRPWTTYRTGAFRRFLQEPVEQPQTMLNQLLGFSATNPTPVLRLPSGRATNDNYLVIAKEAGWI